MSLTLDALFAAAQAEAVGRVAAALNAAGIPFFLFKGLALQPYYPPGKTRPAGDVDLLVEPARLEEAAAVLGWKLSPRPSRRKRPEYVLAPFPDLPADTGKIDLHGALRRFRLDDWDALWRHAITRRIGGAEVRTPGAEHHLRLAAIHCLISGAHRRKWLDDIAALLAHAGRDFGWALAHHDDPVIINWIGVAAKLSGRFAGADLSRLPPEIAAVRLPRWVERRVGASLPKPVSAFHPPPRLAYLLRHSPTDIPAALVKRWPNPIGSYAQTGLRFGRLPPVAAQIRYVAQRTLLGPV